MPNKVHIKWYETPLQLDDYHTMHYSRLGDTVTTSGVGGIFAMWSDCCQSWRVKWEKVNERFEYHFEVRGDYPLSDPLKIQIPVLKASDKWFKAHRHEFNLTRTLSNRVNQLFRFLLEKNLIVPEGTLFIVTRAGIQEALNENRSWSLVMGYSAVEPTPEFSCTPFYLSVNEIQGKVLPHHLIRKVSTKLWGESREPDSTGYRVTTPTRPFIVYYGITILKYWVKYPNIRLKPHRLTEGCCYYVDKNLVVDASRDVAVEVQDLIRVACNLYYPTGWFRNSLYRGHTYPVQS
jgi:hypothetical protein